MSDENQSVNSQEQVVNNPETTPPKSKKWLGGVLGVIVLAGIAFISTNYTTIFWKTYENKEYGFSFKHPSNWIVSFDGDNKPNMSVISPSQKKKLDNCFSTEGRTGEGCVMNDLMLTYYSSISALNDETDSNDKNSGINSLSDYLKVYSNNGDYLIGDYSNFSNGKINGYLVNVPGMSDTVDYFFENQSHIYQLTFYPIYSKKLNKYILSSQKKLILNSFLFSSLQSTGSMKTNPDKNANISTADRKTHENKDTSDVGKSAPNDQEQAKKIAAQFMDYYVYKTDAIKSNSDLEKMFTLFTPPANNNEQDTLDYLLLNDLTMENTGFKTRIYNTATLGRQVQSYTMGEGNLTSNYYLFPITIKTYVPEGMGGSDSEFYGTAKVWLKIINSNNVWKVDQFYSDTWIDSRDIIPSKQGGNAQVKKYSGFF